MVSKIIDFENDFTEEEEDVFLTREEKGIGVENTTLEDIVASKYKLGLPIKQIRKEHNISSGKVYEILARKGVPLRNGRYRSKYMERATTMSQLERQSLILDYEMGTPLEDIYKKYDINKHGCYLILDEANVPRRQDRPLTSTEFVELDEHDVSGMVDKVKNKPDTLTDNKNAGLNEGVSWEIEKGKRTLHITVDESLKYNIDCVNISITLKN